MSATLDQASSIKVSAKTLDNFAAAAGQKYAGLCHRIKQKIKDTPVLDKIVKKVQSWDQKMTETHGAAYKFAKGAVLGTAIGVGLVVAGPEVATAYAAINAARMTGNLLAQAEQARQEGKVSGFSDYVSKNKAAVAMTAASVGMSAAGISAGVINNAAATAVISSARRVAVGGMMTANTAIKMHQINSDEREGKISKEQSRQLKKEHFAELAGNLVGLAAVSAINAARTAHQETDNQQNQEKPAEKVQDNAVEEKVAEAPENKAPETKAPETNAPENDSKPVQRAPMAKPAPENAPQQQEAPAAPREQIVELENREPQIDLPEADKGLVRDSMQVEKELYSSYSQNIDQNGNTIVVQSEEFNSLNGDSNANTVFASVQDVKNSQAKILTVESDKGFSNMYIAEDGKTVELPAVNTPIDANGDGHLSNREIRNWSAQRQSSLQSVLSEAEAKNIVATEINNDQYQGPVVVKGEQVSGKVSYSGDGANHQPSSFNQALQQTQNYMDKVAGAARDLMTNRTDAQGNTCSVNATESQIRVADAVLRAAAGKGR